MADKRYFNSNTSVSHIFTNHYITEKQTFGVGQAQQKLASIGPIIVQGFIQGFFSGRRKCRRVQRPHPCINAFVRVL